MSAIVSIGTAVPAYKHKQEDILEFMLNFYQAEAEDRRKIEVLYRKSGITSRYSVIRDYSSPSANWEFYSPTPTLEPFPGIDARMQLYQKESLPLAFEAAQNTLKNHIQAQQVTHLITVSCTGMAAPGTDLWLMRKMGLPHTTQRTSVNFMGCYAGFHALKQADAICKADPAAIVLVVCVELCTIHFQKTFDANNLTANSLFADGAAGVLIVDEKNQLFKNQPKIKLQHFYAEVEASGEEDMAWEISSSGFLMTLSAYIPQLIQQGIEPLVASALTHLDLKVEDVQHWAIHPGGRKILDVIQEKLSIPSISMLPAFSVLKEYGNMSSVTVFFVLDYLWKYQIDWQKTERVFACGFGPGLTMETAVLETSGY